MFPTEGLPAIGRHINSKPEKVSAPASHSSFDAEKLERLSAIKSWSEAGKEALSLRKVNPAILPASSFITGFTVDVAPARGRRNIEPAIRMQTRGGSWFSSACCTAQYFSSSVFEGSRSSKTERSSVAVPGYLVVEDVKLKKMRDMLEEDGGNPYEDLLLVPAIGSS